MPRRFLNRLTFTATLLCLLACLPLHAQQPARHSDAELAASLGLTKSSGSLPGWEKPDAQSLQDLTEQVRSTSPGVFIIGSPNGGYGTGFVISKEHRLLATNAHVADIYGAAGTLLAIGNDSTDVHKVEHIWYHPGVIRQSSGVQVRSANRADGNVYPMGPDVAVIRLAGDGQLPDALPLAGADELDDLFGRPVGMIGFPGHDTVHWPQLGEAASASYHQGVVARVSDFANNAKASDEDRQFIRHTMGSWGGFSGSPIFTANGRVAAIHNSAGSRQSGSVVALLAYGIRIDCLWELLAWHDLTDKVALPVPAEKLRLARFHGDDPNLARLREVERLTQRGNRLAGAYKAAEAGALYNQAIQLMPNFAPAHNHAANNYMYYLEHRWDGSVRTARQDGQLDDYLTNLDYALTSSRKALELEPTNVDFLLTHIHAKNHFTIAQRDLTGVRPSQSDATEILDKVLQNGNLTHRQRAAVYNVYSGLSGDYHQVKHWLDKAIEMLPYEFTLYYNRADNHRHNGHPELAAADFRRADELRRIYVQNIEVWKSATSMNTDEFDPPKALRLAEEICRATNHQHWEYLQALGAAYAANRKFDEAVHWAAKALELAPEEEKAKAAAIVRLFRSGKALRIQR